jgi:hypothetical protein
MKLWFTFNLNEGDEKAIAWGCDLTYDLLRLTEITALIYLKEDLTQALNHKRFPNFKAAG